MWTPGRVTREARTMRGRGRSGLAFAALLAVTLSAAPSRAADPSPTTAEAAPAEDDQRYGQKWNVQVVVAPVLPKLIKGNLIDPSHVTFGLGKRSARRHRAVVRVLESMPGIPRRESL